MKASSRLESLQRSFTTTSFIYSSTISIRYDTTYSTSMNSIDQRSRSQLYSRLQQSNRFESHRITSSQRIAFNYLFRRTSSHNEYQSYIYQSLYTKTICILHIMHTTVNGFTPAPVIMHNFTSHAYTTTRIYISLLANLHTERYVKLLITQTIAS
jgi:hypothetical protein